MDERWWTVRWRRVALGIGVAWAVLLLLKIPASNVMTWYAARDLGKNYPRAGVQLQVLADSRVADLNNGITVSHYGYSLEVPWAKTTVERDFKTIYSIGFSDGSSLLMLDPRARPDMLTPNPSSNMPNENLRAVLGDEAVKSRYDYAKAELSAMPNELSLFHSRRTNARAMMLLTMKSVEIPEGMAAVYPVSGPHIRGFQFGDPGKGPTFIELLLFDDHDRGLELVLHGPSGFKQPVLTQEQINGIIASVQTVD